MMDPDATFQAASRLAMASWLALAASLFLGRWRAPIRQAVALGVPALLGLAYAVLITAGFREADGAGFGSLAQVRALFASDAGLAAGWLHYLAFDLFVGAWMCREASDLPRVLTLASLPPTFLVGPVGLILYLAFAGAWRLLGRRP